jgi:hypothetical protein
MRVARMRPWGGSIGLGAGKLVDVTRTGARLKTVMCSGHDISNRIGRLTRAWLAAETSGGGTRYILRSCTVFFESVASLDTLRNRGYPGPRLPPYPVARIPPHR